MVSTTTKWIIGIAFGLVGCLILAIVLWWNTSGSNLYHSVADNMLEGRRVGRGLAATVCVDSAVVRQSAAMATEKAKGDSVKPDIAALMAPSLFTQGCLSVATGGDELCRDIPLQTKDRNATREWAAAECGKRQVEDHDSCLAVMANVQIYCARRVRTRG